MARWKTLNRRARRKREREAEIVRNLDKLLVPALEAVMFDAMKAAAIELANAMQRMALAWIKAGEELSRGWPPLDPKYARLKQRRWDHPSQWPDVVLEDILDAEVVGE